MAPATARASEVLSSVLADQTELIVVPRPGVPLSSFRLVVRTGGKRDPASKAGLAHVLEHMLFQRSQDVVGTDFRERVRAVGGSVNAYTSALATTYTLDAPREAFAPLVKDYLKLITSPQFPGGAVLERELGIIQMENVYHPPRAGLARLVESALFAGADSEASIIGTRESRDRITREDLLEFFNRYYVTSNISVVFTGDVTEAQAREMLAGGYRLPPAEPEERVQPLLQTAAFPIQQSTRAPKLFLVFGYPLEAADRPACRTVADLLRLRLLLAVHVREPLVSSLNVDCLRLRGNELLLAFAYAPSEDASELPAQLAEAFKTLGKSPPTAAERKLLATRGERLAALTNAAGPLLADTVADAAAQPRAGASTNLDFLQAPPALTPAEWKELVRRNFHEEREVRITFTPFEE
ncbi:insulinase family protein [Myxococcaceae bacterium GXIMD 01537]